MWFLSRPATMPTPETALPGRPDPILRTPRPHHANGRSIVPLYPDGLEVADFALGCFWGVEKKFWQTPGVIATAVGYQGGSTTNPT